MEIVIVSIGALSKNPLWEERTPVRTSHATTTLIAAGKDKILVDPSLPANMLEQRLNERTGLTPDAITTVFLTNWRPVHRRALESFGKARWLMNEKEIDNARGVIENLLRRHDSKEGDPEVVKLLQHEATLLARVQPAPDELTDGVDLFPLPGYTEGQTGLLLAEATRTTVLAGDAVPTAGHFLAGRVFDDAFDLERAKESLAEMYEIADVIIPGHDNLFITTRAGGN